jgi:hypothetical protein
MSITKKYRFFIIFINKKNKMTIHFKKSCYIVNNVICNVPCETKWKSTQPKLVMQGFATNIRFENNVGIIE